MKQENILVRSIGALGLVAFAIFIWIVLGTGLKRDPNYSKPVLVGKPAFDFNLAWIQGAAENSDADGRMSLSDFSNKPLILNFWASWCVSCRSEAKEMEKFWRKHNSEVNVVGIAIQDTDEAALEFAKYYGKTYFLGLDFDGKAAIDYGVTGVPETFFIDRHGKIIHKLVGPATVSTLEEWLAKIM